MARTNTIPVVIDGKTYPAAKLTLGALRDLKSAEEAALDNDARVRVTVDAIRRALLRADPAFAMTVEQIEDVLDGEDLSAAYQAVMAHTIGGRDKAAGETQSP